MFRQAAQPIDYCRLAPYNRKSSIPLRLLFVIVAVLLASVYGSSGAFRDLAHAPATPGYLREPGVRRIRAVVADMNIFGGNAAGKFRRKGAAAAAPVAMNFFADTLLMIRWKTADQSGGLITWTGMVDGARYGHAVLVVSGRSLTGNFTRGDGLLYQVRTAEDGTVWVRELDQRVFEAIEKHR